MQKYGLTEIWEFSSVNTISMQSSDQEILDLLYEDLGKDSYIKNRKRFKNGSMFEFKKARMDDPCSQAFIQVKCYLLNNGWEPFLIEDEGQNEKHYAFKRVY